MSNSFFDGTNNILKLMDGNPHFACEFPSTSLLPIKYQ